MDPQRVGIPETAEKLTVRLPQIQDYAVEEHLLKGLQYEKAETANGTEYTFTRLKGTSPLKDVEASNAITQERDGRDAAHVGLLFDDPRMNQVATEDRVIKIILCVNGSNNQTPKEQEAYLASLDMYMRDCCEIIALLARIRVKEGFPENATDTETDKDLGDGLAGKRTRGIAIGKVGAYYNVLASADGTMNIHCGDAYCADPYVWAAGSPNQKS